MTARIAAEHKAIYAKTPHRTRGRYGDPEESGAHDAEPVPARRPRS